MIKDKVGTTLLFITLDCAAVSGASMTRPVRVCVRVQAACECAGMPARAHSPRSLESVQRLHLYNDNRSEMYYCDIFLIDNFFLCICFLAVSENT